MMNEGRGHRAQVKDVGWRMLCHEIIQSDSLFNEHQHKRAPKRMGI